MPPPGSSPAFAAIARLAERVLAGEVVFFIGAGFSLDSEGNSATRLVARLLARLLAMGTCLAAADASQNSQARMILDALGRVFGLSGATRRSDWRLEPVRCMTDANIRLLAREYYNFNDWSVSALATLASEMIALPEEEREARSAQIHSLENFLLATTGRDPVPLDRVEWSDLGALLRAGALSPVDVGKALFLDTMGFANEQIMCGAPRGIDVEGVAESYAGRLRPRHHALARLAREGLSPILVTTNYDLLIEGAYRLAGLVEQESTAALPSDVPQTEVPRFCRIAGADQFFSRGGGHRTALILKIHGCVESYRLARADAAANAWARYLPAMVFTYREIQTWRSDAWSRDLIRTLLRTRTLAMCGYSGADPVMHSTFREVYEEMAQRRPPQAGNPEVERNATDERPGTARRDAPPASAQDGSERAPVFFFDIADKREFYSLEILRAATDAGGYRPAKLVEHPNHIEFQVGTGCPSLDDEFRWLSHCVVRELQKRALRSRLRRLVPRLLGGPRPDAELDAVCGDFEKLCDDEIALVTDPDGSRWLRDRLDRVVGWTWHFIPSLLRELALADLVDSRRGPGGSLRCLRLWRWYFPASERPEWTAWATVMELAIRRMVATWRGWVVARPCADDPFLQAEDSRHAAVSFRLHGEDRGPRALCIRLAGFGGRSGGREVTGAFRKIAYWQFGEKDVPWPTDCHRSMPDAAALWRWATRREGPAGKDDLEAWFTEGESTCQLPGY